MRHLIVVGLVLSMAGAAGAQTEVIIRRPGEKDQVIRLDEEKTAATLDRVRSALRTSGEVARESLQQMKVALEARRGDDSVMLRVMPLARKAEVARVEAGMRLAETQSAMHDDVMQKRLLELQGTELKHQVDGQLRAMPMIIKEAQRATTAARQPHLGVVLDYGPRETDRYGAYVSAVTPGSPADRAGILAGDVITRLAGKSVAVKDRRSDDDDSSPSVKLTQILAQLTPGKAVEIELRRGSQTHTSRITPEEDENVVVLNRLLPDRAVLGRTMTGRTAAPSMAQMPSMSSFSNSVAYGTPVAFDYYFNSNGLFANLELAPVNEQLGAYFGTSEGVLVVNTGAMHSAFIRKTWTDSTRPATPRAISADTLRYSFDVNGTRVQSGNTLNLEPGDVIVSVDGRKVTTPSQLMRIVSSYEHGEEFKLQIMRQKHAETLTNKMP